MLENPINPIPNPQNGDKVKEIKQINEEVLNCNHLYQLSKLLNSEEKIKVIIDTVPKTSFLEAIYRAIGTIDNDTSYYFQCFSKDVSKIKKLVENLYITNEDSQKIFNILGIIAIRKGYLNSDGFEPYLDLIDKDIRDLEVKKNAKERIKKSLTSSIFSTIGFSEVLESKLLTTEEIKSSIYEGIVFVAENKGYNIHNFINFWIQKGLMTIEDFNTEKVKELLLREIELNFAQSNLETEKTMQDFKEISSIGILSLDEIKNKIDKEKVLNGVKNSLSSWVPNAEKIKHLYDITKILGFEEEFVLKIKDYNSKIIHNYDHYINYSLENILKEKDKKSPELYIINELKEIDKFINFGLLSKEDLGKLWEKHRSCLIKSIRIVFNEDLNIDQYLTQQIIRNKKDNELSLDNINQIKKIKSIPPVLLKEAIDVQLKRVFDSYFTFNEARFDSFNEENKTENITYENDKNTLKQKVIFLNQNGYHDSLAQIIKSTLITDIENITNQDIDLIDNLGIIELNEEIANKIIESGKCIHLVRHLDKFKGLNHVEIANKLIVLGYANVVARNLDKFNDLNHVEIANKIIDVVHNPSDIAENLELFRNLDSNIANKIIDSGYSESFIKNLDKFEGLDYLQIIDKIIEKGFGPKLVHNIENNEKVQKFIHGLNPEVVEYLEKFINKYDSDNVYKLRNKIPLGELMSNYNYFRIKSWQEINILKDDDKKYFELLLNVIDEKTFGDLWKNHKKEDLHIIGPQIIKMSILTGENTDTFRGQYLERIIKDGASYENNLTSLSYFHNIVESLNEDFNSVLNEAGNFEQTKVLAEQLKKEGPFKSWETLKKYYELSEILKNREVLEKLQKLKDHGKNKQYKFFSDLAFHPGSKISMQTVFKFMEDPAQFLDVEDEHSREAHERKKPSNYTKFEYLDISAENLRDALIEGNLDKLQYFKPFEASYKIADRNYSNQEIVSLLKDALGSFREKIEGNAKNPGKLFKVTQEILKKYNIEYKDLVNNPNLLQGEFSNELEKVLFDNNFGIQDVRKFEEYLVKIHPKSSPEGHLAGNDTACCMPFGSGKNNVYMYNLGCSILTVQRKVGDKYRTIAQSVLTPDVDIKHSISDLVNNVQDETLLSNVITEDLTQKKNIIITADNIEVAPNSDKYKPVIEKIYSDFVSRYAHDLDSNEVEKNRMLIGKGYSDLSFSKAKEIDNTFIPITPVAYSDNYGEKVFELPLPEKSEIIPLPNYGRLQKTESEVIDPDLPKGVKYLTAHDTLRVSYMEGKVYAENESLVQYIHRIGNELTAKDINNSFKGRPNLSFKVEDDNGAILGYMIAYEGAEKGNRNQIDEKVIYISDLAADTTRSKLAGGRLIKAFENIVKREYLDKENPLPIIAQARENTSYKIILNQLNDLGKSYGYKYELEENGSYELGSDTMYQVKLIPVKL